MTNSVNILNNNYSSVNNSAPDNLSCSNKTLLKKQNTNINNSKTDKVSFGDREDSNYSPGPLGTLKNVATSLTNDFVGFIGINAALLWLQRNINEKFLIGKINNHFTKNISQEDSKKLDKIADTIDLKKVGNPEIIKTSVGSDAYYTHLGNRVVVGPENHSAIFHELGHAWEENSTSLLKKLQHGRGRYADASMVLYFLMAQRKKTQNDGCGDENQGISAKIKNLISKNDAIIPLLAFSPELITEAAASIKGFSLLKEHNNMLKNDAKTAGEALSKSALKNIKRSYATCFLTYLFIPVSMMLVEAIRNSADKAVKKRRFESSPF